MKNFLKDIDFYEVPATADILNCSHVPEPYLFTKTFAEAEDDVAFIIHSSGTTGTRTNDITLLDASHC